MFDYIATKNLVVVDCSTLNRRVTIPFYYKMVTANFVVSALHAFTFTDYCSQPQQQRNTFPLMQSFFSRRCTFVKDSVLLSRSGFSGSLVRPNLDRTRKYHGQKEETLRDRSRTSSARVRERFRKMKYCSV